MTRQRLPSEEDDLCSVTSDRFHPVTRNVLKPHCGTGGANAAGRLVEETLVDEEVWEGGCHGAYDPPTEDEEDFSSYSAWPVDPDVSGADAETVTANQQALQHDSHSVPGLTRSDSPASSRASAPLPVTPLLVTTTQSLVRDFETPSESSDSSAPVRRPRRAKRKAIGVIQTTHTGVPTKKHRRDPHVPMPGISEEAHLTPHGLDPITVSVNLPALYLFFRFVHERHTMYERRQRGVPRDEVSTDETMRKMFVGGVFRELDKGSVRVKREIIEQGSGSFEEVCFRVFLFCGFYDFNTYQSLVDGLGYVPRWSTFQCDLPTYERILHTRSFVHGQTLYTSGFQLVPPTKLFGVGTLPHYAATLRFVLVLMADLPARLQSCATAIDASKLLQTYPTLGAFLSLNLLCYLNDTKWFSFAYRDYASCGPGSRAYLRKIFGKVIDSIAVEEAALVWLRQSQWRYWTRLGVDPPSAADIPGIKPGLRCLDIENALCWCIRYAKASEKNGWDSLASLPLPHVSPLEETTGEPAWCEEKNHVASTSRGRVVDDYDEVLARLPPIEDGAEVYEVEKIVCRTGGRGDKDPMFRVRWKGYTPEDDTWERASSLRNGAEEVVADWLAWETKVDQAVERVRRDYPWRRPDVMVDSSDRVKQQAPTVTVSSDDAGDRAPADAVLGGDDGASAIPADPAASDPPLLDKSARKARDRQPLPRLVRSKRPRRGIAHRARVKKEEDEDRIA